MFIMSKHNYMVRRADGSSFSIGKNFVGDIPKDVANSNLVRRAIRGGGIVAPEGKKDKQLERADASGNKKAAQNDKRPDADQREVKQPDTSQEEISEPDMGNDN